MKSALGWLGRTGLLYLVLCLATAFYLLAWPAISSQLSGENLRQDAMSIGAVREVLVREQAEAQTALETRAEAMRTASRSALETRLEAVTVRKTELEESAQDSEGWLDSVRPSRILAVKRMELEIAAADAEIAALNNALDARIAAETLDSARSVQARYSRIYTKDAVRRAEARCAAATDALKAFEARNPVDREARDIFFDERAQLTNAKNTRCGNAARYAAQRERGLAAAAALTQARERYAAAQGWSAARLPDPAQTLTDRTLGDILRIAAWALLAALLLPLAIRTLFYYVFAPLVQAGPPIRLAEHMTAQPIPAKEPGGPSLLVSVPGGQELLIRQGFLQSSPAAAQGRHPSRPAARTRWLLDPRRPFTSIASGMTFLTQTLGAGGTYGLSTQDDPFAELARIALPAGARLVLQPRALVAVLQPVGQPVPIRSRWRFGLHAWLTFQFRYLVFHGPATLIVKGGRGVRMEPAQNGRVFGQSQLIGYSADLAYTVQRNETFAPYLLGRAPLLRDKVAQEAAAHSEEGAGLLVLEEAPMAGRKTGVRGGLEGLFDAALKAFGI